MKKITYKLDMKLFFIIIQAIYKKGLSFYLMMDMRFNTKTDCYKVMVFYINLLFVLPL